MAYNAYGGPGEEREKPNPMVFGTPMQPKPRDSAGAAVPPMLGANGGVSPQGATPSMAQGGAIPDGDMASNAGVQDDTTASLNLALQTINQLMMYGRKKNGLPSDEPKQQQADAAPTDGAIPDDSGGDESYAGGGAIADDIEAGRGPPDDEQYGRPEVVDDPDAVRPPISGDNLDRNMIDARMGGTQPSVPISGDNLDRSRIPVDESAGLNTSVPSGAGNAQGGGASAQPQSIIGYLQGKEALPPEVVKQAEDQVHGDPAQKAVGAVARLAEQNPDAGFGAMQYNRAAYNAKAGFAWMALNGTAQKPADLAAATKAATQATPHLLDGTLLTFAPGEGGVTASANGEKLNLTLPQFNQFLDIRKSGQYDQIFEKGGGLIALKEIMKGAGEPVGNLQMGTGTMGAASTGPGRGIPQGVPPAAGASAPDKLRPEYYAPKDSDSVETRAARMGLPGLNKQQAYIDAQNQREEENDINRIKANNPLGVAETRGKYGVESAQARAAGTVGAADARSQSAERIESSRATGRQARTDAQLKIAAEKLLQSDRAEQGRNSRAVLSTSEKTLVGMAAAGQKLTPEQKRRADDLIMSKEQLGPPGAPQPNTTRQSGAPQMSPQDQQALLWANANPNDPRAAKIKQLHGVR